MGNSFKTLIKMWYVVRKPFLLVFSLAIIFLFGVYLFSLNRVAGDAASHLLLAVSPILKIGSPYKDFWEIKPPVWPLILYLWSNLFGFGILSIRIINIIVAAIVVFLTWLVYKKVFPTPVFEIIFFFTIIIVLSPILHTFLLTTEFLGLALSMGALLVLIGSKKDFPKFYFSGILFFIASQTKEPFTFTILAVLPVLFESLLENGFPGLIKNVMQLLLGIFTSLAGIYIYLTGLGSVGAYIEIYKYKQVFFQFKLETFFQNFATGFISAERTFTEFPLGYLILLILAALLFYLVNIYKKILSFDRRNSHLIMKQLVITNSEKIIKYSVFFYAFGSFLGFALGGSFGQHYLIQVVIPFYIINGFVISYLFNNASFLLKKSRFYFYLSLLLIGFSMVIILPKRQYLSSYLSKTANFSMTDNISGLERRITELTTKDQCVLSVYGWGVSENYLYSERRPCTRFFLANIVREDWQKKEYVKDIIENPPAVMAYRTSGADLDVTKFESEVVNISKIIKNCYVQDTIESMIFIPKTTNIGDLKNCINANSI
jgi:hypothetical protein